MPEQLRFEQLVRDRRAVDGNKRSAPPHALLMQGAGDQLFAGAGFTGDQDSGIGDRVGLDLAKDLQHPRAGPDQAELPGRGTVDRAAGMAPIKTEIDQRACIILGNAPLGRLQQKVGLRAPEAHRDILQCRLAGDNLIGKIPQGRTHPPKRFAQGAADDLPNPDPQCGGQRFGNLADSPEPSRLPHGDQVRDQGRQSGCVIIGFSHCLFSIATFNNVTA